MPAVYIPRWVQITLAATQEGQDRRNVINYRYDGTSLTAAQLLDIATNFWAAVSASYRALASASVTFQWVTARDMAASTGLESQYFIPGSPVGTNGTDPEPGNVAGAIQWKTGRPGKQFRGRTELFGFCEDSVSGSLFNSAGIAHLVAVASSIFGFDNTPGPQLDLAIASRRYEFLNVVTTFLVDAFTDSMRSRLIGRGN